MKVRKEKDSLLVLSVLLIVLGIFWVPEANATGTYAYRMPITVKASQVSNGPLTNFPFLFSSTSTNLRTTGHGGQVTDPSGHGYDIIFRALDDTTCGGAGLAPCTLNHEIEKYDDTDNNHQFVAWVKVPSINTGTTIYVYYGNSSITTSQENITGVWNDGCYRGVYHLPNGAAGTLTDSSTLANNLTNHGLAAETSKIDGGAVDNGSSYAVAGSPAITGNTQLTAEAWVKVANGYSGSAEIVGQYYSDTTGAFELYMTSGWIGLYIHYNGTATRWGASLINDGNWHHVVGVYYASSYMDMYIDGILSDYVPLTGTIPPWTNNSTGVPLMVGAYSSAGTPTGFLTGSIDEIRVSWYARSADWIKTEYNNQSAPGSFYALGTQKSTAAASFGYRMPILVSSSALPTAQCSGATPAVNSLTNFPFLFSTTSASLATTGNGGHVENAGGYDIIFRALDDTTCGGAGKSPCTLSHEIEKYDGTSGTFTAWVKVPSIANSTTIYLYYGNASIVSSLENKTDVWNDGYYKGVWHLGNGATLGTNDSTSGGSNLTADGGSASAGTGQIGGGAFMIGSSSQYLAATTNSSLEPGGTAMTLSAWVKPTINNAYMGIIDHESGSPYYGYFMYMYSDGKMYADFAYDKNSKEGITNSTITGDGNTWTYLVSTYDGSNGGSGIKTYVNGALDTTTPATGSIAYNTDVDLFVGARGGYYPTISECFHGTLDEARVSSTNRSACWIKTEYGNQSAPGTFYTLGSESSNPPTIITLSSFSVSQQGNQATISWQTKSEVDNLGFNLFRTQPDGTGSVKLNGALIPGLISSAIGKDYTYVDSGAKAGTTVCYMLEDIDLHEKSTYHGPACAYTPAPGSSTSQDMSGQGTAAGGGVGGGTGAGSSQSASTGSSASQGTPGSLPSSTGAVTEVTMRSLSAIKGPQGVVIQWQTGYEVRNLGFHVYRDDGGKHIRINHDLLLGSALIAGTHTILRSGHAYDFFDQGSSGGTYWVEDVDLSGKRTLHGPVQAAPGVLPEKKTRIQPPVRPPRLRRVLANVDFPGGNNPVMTQWALAGIPALKLLIQKEGIYRVSFTQLTRAGFDTRRPKMLQLYVDGTEQPLKVTTTGIEFYATGVDTPFTDTRTYWLVNGLAPGKRIAQTAGTGGIGPQSFPATVVLQPRSFYFPALLNGEASNFFGDLIYQNGTTLTLSAPHVTQGDASLTVRLQGVTDSHHSIQVRINGSFVGNLVFDGQTPQEQLFPLGRGQLTEGMNQVSLTSSGEEDIAAVDTLTLTYSHTYTADGDHLRFSAPAGSGITLSGFTKPTTIFDVTDTVTEVAGQIVKEGIHLRVPGKGTRTLLAVTDAAYMTPELTANTPSAWHAAHRADLVIITHEDFRDSLTPLVQQRKKQGLSVAVIDIEDLYDEFSYGQKTPLAIKAFLARTKPHYVLLAGGATYDPRNYLGRGALDFVPTKLIDTAMIETASDDWFVDFDSNGLPDIPIGRLPVTTAQEAAATIAKLIRYEQMSPSPKALYVADTADQVGDFEAAIRPMESLMSFVPEELFRSKLGTTTASLLITRLTEGVGLITYLGHGSLQLWDGDVLDTTIADTLTNTTYPFFLAMTCLNGYFIIPSIDSLASALVTDAAGAVGMVASSTLTAFPPQAVLGSAFLSHLSTGATVGEALLAAKQSISDPDVQKSYLLFGDPSMRVRR